MNRSRSRIVSLLVALAAGSSTFAGAGEFEIGAIGGLQQTGSLSSREGTIDLDAGPLYGIVAGWRVKSDGLVEVSWTRQQSEASGDLASGPVGFDVVVDALEFAGIWETRPDDMRPFLGLSIGGTRFGADGENFVDGWNASGAISGGVRWFFGEHAVLRLEARASGIYFADGGALGCRFSSGVGACGVSASGSLLGAVSARAAISARF